MSQFIKSADVIFLAISDEAILDFYNLNLKNKTEAFCVHLSGAVYSPDITGVHPLGSFAQDVESQQVPLFIDSKKAYLALKGILPDLKLIPPELKSKYHLMACLFGNLVQALSLKLKNDELGKYVEVSDFKKIYEQSLENMLSDVGVLERLTGPVVRGDLKTIELHKKSIKNDKDLLEFYESFVNMYDNQIKRLK